MYRPYTIPFLTVDHMQMAMEFLRTGRLSEDHPLLGSIAVHLQLYLTPLPARNRYLYALGNMLSDLIVDLYTRYRQLHGLHSPDPDATLAFVIDELAADAVYNHPPLIGASLLYHRYVRTDLALDIQKMMQTFALSDRTGRRYQREVLETLTHQFLQLESAAIIAHRDLRTRIALPTIEHTWLTSAEHDAIVQFAHRLQRDQVMNVQIADERSRTRRAAAHQLMTQLMEAGAIDDVVWIDVAVEGVIDAVQLLTLISEQLLLPVDNSQPTSRWRRFIAGQLARGKHTGIILNDVTPLLSCMESVQLVMSHVLLVITAPQPLLDQPGVLLQFA